MELLQMFDFDIEYVKGKKNVNVGIPSRRLLANVISYIQKTLMDEIKMQYVDEFLKLPFDTLFKEPRIVDETEKLNFFELKDEVLCYSGLVCISRFEKYRLDIMNNFHDIPIASHPSF